MNRPRQQFFAGPRLTRNENCGIGGGDLGYLLQHLTYSIGGSDDFLEQQVTVDFFSQRDVFVPRPILRAFAMLDVRSGRIPSGQASLFVVVRVVTD